jgi:hypothetical protein
VLSDTTMVVGKPAKLSRFVGVLQQHFAAVSLRSHARESFAAPLECSRLRMPAGELVSSVAVRDGLRPNGLQLEQRGDVFVIFRRKGVLDVVSHWWRRWSLRGNYRV